MRKCKLFVTMLVIIMTAVPTGVFSQPQPFDPDGQNGVATDTPDVSGPEAQRSPDFTTATVSAAPRIPSGYVQNDETLELEEAIAVYNERYHSQFPQEYPYISEINERNLVMLINMQLIQRDRLDSYLRMILINGQVYVRQERTDPEFDIAANNLLGALELSARSLADQNTRGVTRGTEPLPDFRHDEHSIWLRRIRFRYRVPILPPPMNMEFRGEPTRRPRDYLSNLD